MGIQTRRAAAAGGLGLLMLASQPATADDSGSEAGAAAPVFSLGVVEVRGARSPIVTPAESVSAEAIQTWHRDDLSEAISLLPGVHLQNVGQRRERLIAVRGYSSRQVPLFIDGVPVYVPYDGNVDFSRFGVDYVSEIVVGKGLASLLYGPNVLGGAINVISRKPVAPLEISAASQFEQGEAGVTLASRATASVGARHGSWYAHATYAYFESGGYALPDSFKPTANEDGGRRENSGSGDQTIAAKVGYTYRDDDEIALAYYRQDGQKDSPPYAGRAPGVQARFWRWPYWDKQSFYLSTRNGLFGNQATLRTRVYYDTFRNSLSSYDNASYSSFTRPFAFQDSAYSDYTYGGNADVEWRWNPDHATRVAIHGKQDVHRERDAAGLPQERYEDLSGAIAIEHGWRLTERVTITPSYGYSVQRGLRADNVSNGSTTRFPPGRADAQNAQMVLDIAATATGRLTAGFSRKTRFPTIKDRYSFRLGSAIPNAQLAPESAWNYEFGWHERRGRWELDATLFQSDLDDAIENVTIPAGQCSAPNPTCFQLQNVGEQSNRGAELALGWQWFDALKIDAQATLLDRDNRSRPELRQLDTPEQKYRLGLRWTPLTGVTGKFEAQYETRRWSTTDGARYANGYTLLNSFVRYAPGLVPGLGIEAGVRNLADQKYAYQEGFFEPGRTWLLQLDWRLTGRSAGAGQ